MYEVVIERSFPAVHKVIMPDGIWERSHEHVWKLEVAIKANKLDEYCFAIEFGEMQGIIDKAISVLAGDDLVSGEDLNEIEAFKDTIPTAEVVAKWIYEKISPELPIGVSLLYVDLTEAPGCRVKYYN